MKDTPQRPSFKAVLRTNFANCCQSRVLSGENLVRACTDGSLENGERFGSTLLPND